MLCNAIPLWSAVTPPHTVSGKMLCTNIESAEYCSADHAPDYTLHRSINLGISRQELCPHPAREETVLSNLLILFC